MFDRISNGWQVAAQSWRVLRQDKQLVLFPIMSGLAALVVLASFALPLFMVPNLQTLAQGFIDTGDHEDSALAKAIGAIILFVFYFVNYFVMVFFNTALSACAIARFRGAEPTVGLGLTIARQRLPQIFGWSLLAASVGTILNMIEERSEWLGRLVIGIIGGLWTAATYLVVPTLAVEGLGPVDSLKRSIALVRDVWGEGLAGNFSFGLIGFLLMLPAIGVIALAIYALPGIGIALVCVGAFVYLIGLAVVMSAVKQVFIAGLYVYATDKTVPAGFDGSTMRSAFAPKR